MASVTLEKVRKSFGHIDVIPGVDLTIDEGEFVVFVGPSGCGKSTLLRMIAGLEDISSGSLKIDDLEMSDVDAGERGVSMVFQSYALYPHMNVDENLSFGLRMRGNALQETKRRVGQASTVLQLQDYLSRLPKQLSGGQRQRVAIGRAIVGEPKVFLFDEPLSNLDAELRVRMRVEISRLHQRLGSTMIYVTHDQTEAMTLADRIVVLRSGCVEQVGRPLDLYQQPANRFVAGFIGSPKMNFLDAEAESHDGQHQWLRVPAYDQARLSVDVGSALPAGMAVTLGIRPEHFYSDASLTPGRSNSLTLTAEVVEHLGATSYLYADTAREEPLIVARPEGMRDRPGSVVTVGVQPDKALLFDSNGARIW